METPSTRQPKAALAMMLVPPRPDPASSRRCPGAMSPRWDSSSRAWAFSSRCISAMIAFSRSASAVSSTDQSTSPTP
ncbi:hypothetical protein [Actinomadura madurae]|uniref:hypothetical protein n=1 Tax=Actinomadura madurae TaxID=1993 RepID=UPI0027E2D74B|nr:hypothetical protein [Actinomadura madurae]